MRISDHAMGVFLAKYYSRLSARRLLHERKVFQHFFPSTRTIIDKQGKINFVTTVTNGSDVCTVRVVLNFSAPFSQPKCWITPAPKRHTHLDGSMCVHFEDEWNSERTAAQVLVAACDLLWGDGR